MAKSKSIKYTNIDGQWVDPATLTRYPVRIQWDREGENVETIEFHSRKERNAFLSGVMQGNGWDAPDWSFLPEISPAPDSCGKGCCVVDEYHAMKDSFRAYVSSLHYMLKDAHNKRGRHVPLCDRKMVESLMEAQQITPADMEKCHKLWREFSQMEDAGAGLYNEDGSKQYG